MTREEYTYLFHRAQLNLVAFRKVYECDIEIMKMVEMAVAAEREACAKLCDDRASSGEHFIEGYAEAKGCADAIRARGEK